jgi:hypothetical protein
MSSEAFPAKMQTMSDQNNEQALAVTAMAMGELPPPTA